MPTRILPDSIPTIFRCLTAAQEKYTGTAAPDRALSVAQMTLIGIGPTSYLVRLSAADQALRLATAAQAPLSAELAVQAVRTRMFVSHFHQVLDLGIARGKFAAGARSFYGRDVHATSIPDLNTHQALAEAVLNIGAGESARATAEGAAHVPMAMPSASEVDDAVGAFMDARTGSAAAQSNTNAKQEAVQALLAEGLSLTADVYDTVEFFYPQGHGRGESPGEVPGVGRGLYVRRGGGAAGAGAGGHHGHHDAGAGSGAFPLRRAECGGV